MSCFCTWFPLQHRQSTDCNSPSLPSFHITYNTPMYAPRYLRFAFCIPRPGSVDLQNSWPMMFEQRDCAAAPTYRTVLL